VRRTAEEHSEMRVGKKRATAHFNSYLSLAEIRGSRDPKNSEPRIANLWNGRRKRLASFVRNILLSRAEEKIAGEKEEPRGLSHERITCGGMA